MAFGVTRDELNNWKSDVIKGEIAFLTHFWYDERFPNSNSVTKVGCSDINKLIEWGRQYGLKPEWIHKYGQFPHFDLLGSVQLDILKKCGRYDHIVRFRLLEQS
ncbi:hypothetical protein [Metabacillus malikii]|uniref:YneQ n=1 Tax=Metabacillus malikii TaxID=1504265 RepID=A0ABT9ZD44_9BACI|nr:hypothetical protein [Metabacillus malikii]MDQ0229935.1 hypothetical protein [Metabacillus malikii]